MIFIIGGAYQGKTEYANKCFGNYEIIDNYHLEVKRQLIAGENPLENVSDILRRALDELVVISNELGCGLVPIDDFEREYREVNGRVNCMLAQNAEQVIRVVCGLGTRIK